MSKYTVSKLLEIARNEIGYHEKASNANLYDKYANSGYADCTKYAKDLYEAGYYNGNKQGVAWCDMFVDWCFYQLANKDSKIAQNIECQYGPLGASCYYSMNYYKEQGRFYKNNPKPGDQVFYTSGGDITHTGIVESVNGDSFTTIEGNTSDKVMRCNRTVSSSYTYGFGRPFYDAETNDDSKNNDDKKDTTLNSEINIGDTVMFTGQYQYKSSIDDGKRNASIGSARVTNINTNGEHKYHLIHTDNSLSNVYGWVNTSDIRKNFEIGDIIRFIGGFNYIASNSTFGSGPYKDGKAKITNINKDGMHKYHIIHTDDETSVYGWVNNSDIMFL